MSSGAYGPQTPAIRRFLVRLAALPSDARSTVVQRYREQELLADFHAADATVGETIERSGRTDARDALGGPLVQIVQLPRDAPSRDLADDDDLSGMLDPIAEPALAALLALLVRDLLPAAQFAVLYQPFAEAIPVDDAAQAGA